MYNRKNWRSFKKQSPEVARSIQAVILDAFHSDKTGESMKPENKRLLQTAVDVLKRNGIARVATWKDLVSLKSMVA